MEDGRVDRGAFKYWGETLVGGETGVATSTTYTVDIENGNVYNLVLTGNCAFTFSNPTGTGNACSFTLLLRQDTTGSRTATWPSVVKWANGNAPVLTTTALRTDVLSFTTVDGGSTWFGFAGAQNFTAGATTLLLHMDGADASTTFTDSSASPHTATAVGNAQLDTAQSKFGTASGLFDGTGDYLTLDGSSDFAFSTGNFTIDFWFRLASVAANVVFYDSRPATTDGAYVALYTTPTKVALYVSGVTQITGTTTLTTSTWYHLALTRSSGSTKLFLNGLQEGSTWTDTTTYLNGASRPTIGTDGHTVANQNMNGWLDEFRVVKGGARWTQEFTPPTSAYS